jgi:hypothetical protein
MVGVPAFLLLIALGRDHYFARNHDSQPQQITSLSQSQAMDDQRTSDPRVPKTSRARKERAVVPQTMSITYRAELIDETTPATAPSEPSNEQALVTETVSRPEPMSEARAQVLQRLMQSRRAGISLLDRDRAGALLNLAKNESILAGASRRLNDFERARIPNTNSRAVYEWQILHDDALATVRTAVQEVKRYQRLVDSFDARLAKAWQELHAAELEWRRGQPTESEWFEVSSAPTDSADSQDR